MVLSDDDLPDTRDILQDFSARKGKQVKGKNRAPRSESTTYTDPEFDELVRNAPLPQCDSDDVLVISSRESSPILVDEDEVTLSSPPVITPGPAPRKRAAESDEGKKNAKKLRFSSPLELDVKKVRRVSTSVLVAVC